MTKKREEAAQGSFDIAPADDSLVDENDPVKPENEDSRYEVFQDTENGVRFRTVNWQWTTIIFLKRKWHAPFLFP